MSFTICNTQHPTQQKCCPKATHKRLIGYTPSSSTFEDQASLLLQPDLPKARVVTSTTLARLPPNALIDRVEYKAHRGTFASKADFNLGLGQLNGPIMSPLIVEGSSATANQASGGAFDIVCDNISGANSRPIVTANEDLVNFIIENPGPVMGTLRVDIYYHVKE